MSHPLDPIQKHSPRFEEVTGPERAQASPRFEEAVAGNGGFESVNDLKTRAPEVFKGIMESIARGICRDAQRGSDRIKAAMRQGEDRP